MAHISFFFHRTSSAHLLDKLCFCKASASASLLSAKMQRILLVTLALLSLRSATCWIPVHNHIDHVRLRRVVCIFAADKDLQSLAERLKQGMNSFKDFDDLEAETKRARLQHFLDITGTKDKVKAEEKLEKFGWDVDQAIKDGKTYTQKMAAVLNKKGVKKMKVAIAQAAVERSASPPPKASRGEYVCRIEVSKNGRGGKTVTTISGVEQLLVDDKKALLKILKNAVAGGGNIAGSGGLEVQGEHAETVRQVLIGEGFTNCKISGGIPKKKKT